MSDSTSETPDIDESDQFVESLVLLDEAVRTGHSISIDTLPHPLSATERTTWEAAKRCLEQLRQQTPPARVYAALPAPDRIGHFLIDRVVGAGGFGIVYQARDLNLNRIVALKVPRPHALFSVDERTRFLYEAHATSQLDHPHIVTAYEAGEADGLPYIAYAFCNGPTLGVWIREQPEPLSPKLAATVVGHLAEAVHYSHQHGILHRDIKPGNVLLHPVKNDDSAAFPFVAKLSDFGLAKLIEADLQATVSSVMMGTPRYMAPEQTQLDRRGIGPATDVYGLGCVLYELITKQPPFTAETAWDVLTQVREYAPAAPRLICPSIPRDLETIALTCLEKEPASRYASAADLADDLHRFLNGEPIRARPTSAVRQLWMWCARHRVVAGLGGAVIASVMLLAMGLALYLVRTTHLTEELSKKNANLTDTVKQLDEALTARKAAQTLAEQRARELSDNLYSIEVARAADAWRRGDVQTMAAALQPFSAAPEQCEFGWRYLWRQQASQDKFRTRLPAAQYFALFTPDGKAVAFAGADSTVRVFALNDFRLLSSIPTGQREINGLCFDPDGKWLATTGDDGTLAIWNLPGGTERVRFSLYSGEAAYQVGYSAEFGHLIACGNSPVIHRIDPSRGVLLTPISGIHEKSVEFLAISPNGQRVLSGGNSREAAIWHLETEEVKCRFSGYVDAISSGAWWPDGRHVAVGSLDGRVDVYFSETGRHVATREMHDKVQSVTVNTAGLLLVGDRNGALNAFSLPPSTKTEVVQLVPAVSWAQHQQRLYGLAASPIDSRFATGARDGTVTIGELQLKHSVTQFAAQPTLSWPHRRSVAGPDSRGRYFRTTPDGFAVFPSNVAEASQQLLPRQNVGDLVLKGDRLLATNRGNLLLWDVCGELGDPEVIPVFEPEGDPTDVRNKIYHLEWIDDQQVLLQHGTTDTRLFDFRTRRVEHIWPSCDCLSVSPDRRWFVLAEKPKYALALYNVAKPWEPLWRAFGHTEPMYCIAFDPLGRYVYSASSDRTVRRWDLATGKELKQLRGNDAEVFLITISPDGRTMATCNRDGQVWLWDLRSDRQLYQLAHQSDGFAWIEFTADGEELWGTDNWRAEHRWSCRSVSNTNGP